MYTTNGFLLEYYGIISKQMTNNKEKKYEIELHQNRKVLIEVNRVNIAKTKDAETMSCS